jgi:hypothetical protein
MNYNRSLIPALVSGLLIAAGLTATGLALGSLAVIGVSMLTFGLGMFIYDQFHSDYLELYGEVSSLKGALIKMQMDEVKRRAA